MCVESHHDHWIEPWLASGRRLAFGANRHISQLLVSVTLTSDGTSGPRLGRVNVAKDQLISLSRDYWRGCRKLGRTAPGSGRSGRSGGSGRDVRGPGSSDPGMKALWKAEDDQRIAGDRGDVLRAVLPAIRHRVRVHRGIEARRPQLPAGLGIERPQTAVGSGADEHQAACSNGGAGAAAVAGELLAFGQ